MNVVDLTLNLACLLLWLNWRSVRLTAATQPSVLSLASTLKRAEPMRRTRRFYLVALLVILILRSVFYWQVGPSVNWTPTIQLAAITLHVRSDFWGRMLLYSSLSFAVTLGIFYFCLILLAAANRQVADSNPIQRLVRLQLGRLAHWPPSAQVFFLPAVVVLSWLVLHRPFSLLGLIGKAASALEVLQQALVLGVGSFLAWKYFIIALLIAYVLNCYVYLGKSQLWSFIDLTGRNLLRPLRWLPLGIGKADLAPLVAILLVLLIDHFGGDWLTYLYQHPPL